MNPTADRKTLQGFFSVVCAKRQWQTGNNELAKKGIQKKIEKIRERQGQNIKLI